jgi:hypothetical protein
MNDGWVPMRMRGGGEVGERWRKRIGYIEKR